MALPSQDKGEVDGGHTFPHTALSTHDQEFMPDTGQSVVDKPGVLGELLNHLRIIGVPKFPQDRL